GERINSDYEASWLVAEFLFEFVQLGPLPLSSHRPQVGRSGNQRRRSRSGTATDDVDPGPGMVLHESLGPEGKKIVHAIRSTTLQRAADNLGPFVLSQLRRVQHILRMGCNR